MPEILSRFRLDGRTAIVTGIGPGIGEHVAKAFASVGANVVCAARTEARVTRVATEIESDGGRAIAVRADVGVHDHLRRLVAAALDAFLAVRVVFTKAYPRAISQSGELAVIMNGA